MRIHPYIDLTEDDRAALAYEGEQRALRLQAEAALRAQVDAVEGCGDPDEGMGETEIETVSVETAMDGCLGDIPPEGRSFHAQRLAGQNFEGAALERADFTCADLVGTSFHQAGLISARFNKANLSGSDFTEAKLRGAYLRNAYLSDAVLDNASCQSADFTNADLTGASFVGANLTGACFDGAHLTGANLEGAYGCVHNRGLFAIWGWNLSTSGRLHRIPGCG